MITSSFRVFRRLILWRNFVRNTQHNYSTFFGTQKLFCFKWLLTASAFCATFRYGLIKAGPLLSVTVLDSDGEIKVPKRLRRFRAFSSIEYHGVEYMTPQDFLDSLILDEPRERVFRRVINNNQLKKMLNMTPPLRKGSDKLFRSLSENGIISYAEYLFLITLLTKSQFAFNIAFLMFDEDDNLQIDKREFLIICSLVTSPLFIEKFDQNHVKSCSVVDDSIYSQLARYLRSSAEIEDAKFLEKLEALLENMISNSLNRYDNKRADGIKFEHLSTEKDIWIKDENSILDTTILIHLFGRSGNYSLSLDEFQLFYNNLQRELIEIEFYEFARGKTEISSVDFARLVLRYSRLHKKDHDVYIKKVYEKTQLEDEGITLQQFEQFSMFLNNLEEFSKAVRLYSAADIPVSQSEFIRAVKCSTGFELNPHLVDVLFKIFDVNDDDKLSYSEFIEIMNDRLHRGFQNCRSKYSSFGWAPFKNCMVHELSSF